MRLTHPWSPPRSTPHPRDPTRWERPRNGVAPAPCPPYSPASAPLTCRGVGDLPGSLPLRVRRSPRRGRAGGTCGPLGAWVSTPARPPRSLARSLAGLPGAELRPSSPPAAVGSAQCRAGGGGMRLPSVGRRHAAVRTSGPLSHRHEGARESGGRS